MNVVFSKPKIFAFGEKVDKFVVNVLNEREVRAASGILFLLAMISFSSAWFTGEFYLMKLFVTFFLIDSIIRVLINPKYSPSLIVGRFMVRRQTVEYTGAPQKRFAWGLGLILGIAMFILIVVQQSFGPINMLLCLTCLTLMFYESAFGICIGCKLYNFIMKEDGKLCPGGVCSPHKREKIQNIGILQIFSILLLAMVMIAIVDSRIYAETEPYVQPQLLEQDEAIDEDCLVPDWAIEIGHRELWKLHNGCD